MSITPPRMHGIAALRIPMISAQKCEVPGAVDSALPQRRDGAIGMQRGGESFFAAGLDAQERARAVIDAPAHADIDQEEHPQVCIQSALFADVSARESVPSGLVSHHDVARAERVRGLREPGLRIAVFLEPRGRLEARLEQRGRLAEDRRAVAQLIDAALDLRDELGQGPPAGIAGMTEE